MKFDSMVECWVGVDNREPYCVVNIVVPLFVNAITKQWENVNFDSMRSNFYWTVDVVHSK